MTLSMASLKRFHKKTTNAKRGDQEWDAKAWFWRPTLIPSWNWIFLNKKWTRGSSIFPPHIVARQPNAPLFNYQISWIACGYLLASSRSPYPLSHATPYISNQLRER